MRFRLIFLLVVIICSTVSQGQTNGVHFDSLANETKNLIRNERYAEVDTNLEKLEDIAKQSSSPELSLTIELLQTELLRSKGDYKSATTKLEKIPYKQLQSESLIAEYYYLQSKLTTDNQKAIQYIRKGINSKKRIPVTGLTDLSHFYNSLGIYWQRLYNLDSAEYYYRKAITTAVQTEKKSKTHQDIALFHQNLALPFAIRQDFERAKKHLFRSVSILNRQHDDNKPDLARNYNNIGRIYLKTGNLDSANLYYKKAENIRATNVQGNEAGLAIVYLNLGELHITKSNLAKARMYFEKARALYQKTEPIQEIKIHKIYLNLGFTYRIEEDYHPAISHFKKALQSSDYMTVGKASRNLANCYFEMQEPDSATFFFKKSLNTFRNRKGGKYDLALSYLYYGNFLVEQKNDKALYYLQKAKDMMVGIFGDFHRDVAIANTYLAKYYFFRKQDYQQALTHAQQALMASVNNFDNPDPTVNPDLEKMVNKNHLITAISLKGKIFYTKGVQNNDINDLEKSFHTFRQAIELINRIRLSYTYESNKLSITEKSQEEYNWILKVLQELYNRSGDKKHLASIFRYMEKGKSAVLLSSITDSKAKITANLPDSIIEKEKWLRTRINGFKNLVYEERQKKATNRNEQKIDEWEGIIFEHQQQYDSLEEYIRQKYNRYYKLRLRPSVMELEEVAEKMSNDEIIIEYTMTDEQLYILTITPGNQTFQSVEVNKETINQLIATIRTNLIVKDFPNFDRESYKMFTSAGYSLFKHVLQPVYDQTNGKDVVFIPDGKMGYIPFELLLTKSIDQNRGREMNFKDLPYLLRERAISYAYSSTLLFSDIKDKKPTKNKVLAMAPSYDNMHSQPVDSLFNTRQNSEILLPIPGVKKEVSNIGETYRSRIYQDAAATEKKFKEQAPEYAALHLAMHTILDDRQPMYSKLVFYQQSGNERDGLLNTYELFELSLNAEMAVLSACNTGYGKLQRGEGIMSLARGFLYAGVPNIVMTLWPIEDKATSKIMKLFYEQLAEGKEKDEALRQAKLLFLNSTDQLRAHPHFWGSFVSIGPDTPLQNVSEKNNIVYWTGGIALLIIMAIWGVLRRFR